MRNHLKAMIKRPMAEINVVPFIDVMLVLLVIFMITAPLLTQGVKVDLPRTDAKALADAKKEPVILTVDADGKYYLNIAEQPNQALPETTLIHLVQQAIQNDASNQRPMLVKGDQQVNYGKVVTAMVILQQAGAKKVGLITAPKPSSKSK